MGGGGFVIVVDWGLVRERCYGACRIRVRGTLAWWSASDVRYEAS